VPETFGQAGLRVELRGGGGGIHNRAESMSVSRQQARTCMIVNQLACPGIGTFMGGRHVTGLMQAAMMIVGFCSVIGWGLMQISAVYKFAFDARATEVAQPPAWLGIGGLALCVVAWFWALFSSFRILNESRRNHPV
jgi:hypothetical protein